MSRFLFLIILALIAFNIWLFNLRRRRQEPEEPGLLPDERLLVHVSLDELMSTTEGYLTTRRILRQSNRWFLSRRESQLVQINDLHSVSWHVQMNLWLLLFGGMLIGLYSPIGILLVMYTLQTPIAAVGFQSHFLPASLFSRVGLGVGRSHVVFRSGKRDQYSQLQRLYQEGLDAWSKVRQNDAGTQPSLARESTEVVPLFAWGSVVWLSVLIVFALAHAQRFLTGHVVVDNPFFGALYLALPLAVVKLDGVRSGLWAALLTFLVLLAVKFPAGFLLGWALNDGVMHFGEAVGILLLLVLIVVMGSAVMNKLPGVPCDLVIPLVWGIGVLALDPGSITSFRTVALILFSVAAYRLSAFAIPAALESRWLKATTDFFKDAVDLVWGPT